MARIPVVTTPSVTPDAMPGVRQNVQAGAEAFSGQTYAAAGRLGEAVGDLGKLFQKMEDDDGRLWALQQASELAITSHQRDLSERENGPADGRGHGQVVLGGFNTDLDARLASAPNKYGEQYLKQYGLQMADDVAKRASSFEFDARHRYRVTAFENELSRHKQRMVDTPDMYVGSKGFLDAIGAELPESERQQLLPKAQGELAATAVSTQILRNPDASLATLRGMQNRDNAPLVQMISAKNDEAGLPPGFLVNLARIESNLLPTAVNNRSGAAGLYQWRPSTAKQYNANPLDPVQSTDAIIRFTKDNQNVLRKGLGRDPMEWELYLAHQQGAGGALKILRAPADADAASQFENPDVINWNAGKGMTMGQFREHWQNQYNRAAISSAASASKMDPVISAAWDDLPAERRIAAINQAESVAKERQSEMRATLAQVTADASAAHMRGEPPQREPSLTEMVTAYGPEKGAIAWREYEDVRSLGVTVNGFKSMSEAEIRLQHEASRPTPGEGYAHKIKLWESAGQAIDGLLKERAADPVTAALRVFPELKKDLEDLKPQDMVAHNNRVWAAQGEMGIPEHRRTLLTQKQADTAVAQWNDTDQPLNARMTPLLAVIGSTQDKAQQDALLLQLDRAGLPKGIIHIAGPMQNDPRAVQTMLAGADARKMAPQFNPEKTDWEGSYLRAVPPEVLSQFTPAFSDSLQEAIHNYYVGLTYEAHDTGKAINTNRLNQAVTAVTGGILEIDRVGVSILGDNFKTFAAWPGQTATEMEQVISLVTDKDLDGAYLMDGDGKGGGRLSVDTFQKYATLISRGNGGYSIQVGENPVLGRDFQPVILNLGGMRPRLEEENRRRAPPPGAGRLRMTHEEVVAQKRYLEENR